MTRICVVGATGRMGRTIIQEALKRGLDVAGAVASPNNPSLGKTLRELGICNLDIPLYGPSKLAEALKNADVYVSFTTPEAELSNIPKAVDTNKRIVMGTTGFTQEQLNKLKSMVSAKVPAVFAPNFSISVNLMLRMLKNLANLPKDYEISIVEMHHSGKKDAPSGTALSIANLISSIKGYTKTVYGRSGRSPRNSEELEVLSVRAGGIPGIHEVIVAGTYDMVSIRHVSFSRRVFALGALYAVEWIMKQEVSGVYSMDDVLESNHPA